MVDFPQTTPPLASFTSGLQGGLGVGLNISSLLQRRDALKVKEKELAAEQQEQKVGAAFKAIGTLSSFGDTVDPKQFQPFLNVISEDFRDKGVDISDINIQGREQEFYKNISKLRDKFEKDQDQNKFLAGLDLLAQQFPKGLSERISEERKGLAEDIRKESLSQDVRGLLGPGTFNRSIGTQGLMPPTTRGLSGASQSQRDFAISNPEHPASRGLIERTINPPQERAPLAIEAKLRILKEGLSPEQYQQVLEVTGGIRPKAKAPTAPKEKRALSRLEFLKENLNPNQFEEFKKIEAGISPKAKAPTAPKVGGTGERLIAKMARSGSRSFTKDEREAFKELGRRKQEEARITAGILSKDFEFKFAATDEERQKAIDNAKRTAKSIIGEGKFPEEKKGKELTPEQAKEFLDLAKGNRAKAEELARKEGFTF